ncbi:MAG: OmpA family protein [Limnohabitans sp.]|nr:OmpA family protein [Limnohabitans sp.]
MLQQTKTKIILLLSFMSFLTSFAQNFTSAKNSETENTLRDNITKLNDKYVVTMTAINTDLSEVGSSFFMEKYIIYSSRKTGAIGAGEDKNTHTPYSSLYCLNVDKNCNLSKPYFFASSLNLDGNEGGLTFTPDQRIAFYTNSSKENTKNYQLYKATFNPECNCRYKWKKEGKVSISNDNYSIENPCVSPDGKKLYFASNMPGGSGGYDLYVVDIKENGELGTPKNLGDSVNTSGDEKFPYAAPKDELYFSSNGLAGYGGQDVFVSRVKKNGYSIPLNLGDSINTSSDEVAFILANPTMGFVTSNRANGVGMNDIYKFSLERTTNSIKGKAIEKNSKIVLPNAVVKLVDSNGDVVATSTTKDDGSYDFNIKTIPLENYTVIASKDGYEDTSNPVVGPIGDLDSDIELSQRPAIVTETKIIVEKIYFDYNKATIKKASTLTLNKIYDVLIQYPEMKINIGAHTDSRGSDVYNMNLSERRAAATRKYLLKKGISQDRITSKGYGETQPLSNCKTKCSEAEFEKDRRIEFLIDK